MKRISSIVARLVVFVGMLSNLQGCGNSDPLSTAPLPPPPVTRATAEGLWLGSLNINGGGSRTSGGLVLSNGDYWFIYSIVGNSAVIGGFFKGNALSSSGVFLSGAGNDFNFDGTIGPSAFAVNGSYSGQSTLAGSLLYVPPGTGSATFTTTYQTAYDLTPSLSQIAGFYSGSGGFATQSPGNGSSATTQFTIDAAGQISGSTVLTFNGASCPFTGTATNHVSGNVYDLTVTFPTSGNCFTTTLVFTGVAYYDAGTQTIRGLTVSNQNPNPGLGLAFVANK